MNENFMGTSKENIDETIVIIDQPFTSLSACLDISPKLNLSLG
jgi:hypothetical protein